MVTFSKPEHSHGVTLLVFLELSSWAEEEEEAARHQFYQLVSGPVQVFGGWAEVDHRAEGDNRGGRGLWDAAGHGAVWSDVGEDRCGRPAAAAGAGGGGGADDVDDDDDVAVDWEDDCVDDVVVHWSTPNETLPLPLVACVFSVCFGCSKQ